MAESGAEQETAQSPVELERAEEEFASWLDRVTSESIKGGVAGAVRTVSDCDKVCHRLWGGKLFWIICGQWTVGQEIVLANVVLR